MSEGGPEFDEDVIEENIQEFIEVHGQEGLFVVYFRDFIFRFIMQELKSPDEDSGVEDSTAQLFFDESGDNHLQTQREEMLEQCEYWARDLVDYLKQDSLLEGVIVSGDIHRLSEEKIETRVERRFHEKLEDWRDDELLDDEGDS